MYSDMPYWSNSARRFRPAGAPILEIAREKSPTQHILMRKMVSGCMGLGWIAFLELPDDIQNGDLVIVTVTHDTGDLWGKLSVTSRHKVQGEVGQQDHTR
jgi:hypothetical protein